MYKYILIAMLLSVIIVVVFRDRNPVFASAEIMIHAPIERVWGIQTDLSDWKSWNSEIQSMLVTKDVGRGSKFVWKAGGITIESEIAEYQPGLRIAWNGNTFGVNANHVWQFTETESGTLVYTEEKFSGFLAWLMPGTMPNQIDKA